MTILKVGSLINEVSVKITNKKLLLIKSATQLSGTYSVLFRK
jgi:hypothetical protein